MPECPAGCSEEVGLPSQPFSLVPCPSLPSPAGMIMVFSTGAFGTYFRLTQDASNNSSHVDFLAPVSAEPVDTNVGLAWLAVGSMCLFIAGERGPMGGWVRATVPMPVLPGSYSCQQVHSYLTLPFSL